MVNKVEEMNTVSFEFDFNTWDMGQLADMQDVADSGKLNPLMEMMAKGTVSWTYEGDPTDVKAWRGLKPSQMKEISKAFWESFGSSFRE